MTAEETTRILAMVVAMEPRNSMSEWTIEKEALYRDGLKNVPFIDASIAMKRIAATEDFRPSLARILEEIASASLPDLETVIDSIKECIRQRVSTANPFTNTVVKLMGGMGVCGRISEDRFTREVADAYKTAKNIQLTKDKLHLAGIAPREDRQAVGKKTGYRAIAPKEKV